MRCFWLAICFSASTACIGAEPIAANPLDRIAELEAEVARLNRDIDSFIDQNTNLIEIQTLYIEQSDHFFALKKQHRQLESDFAELLKSKTPVTYVDPATPELKWRSQPAYSRPAGTLVGENTFSQFRASSGGRELQRATRQFSSDAEAIRDRLENSVRGSR